MGLARRKDVIGNVCDLGFCGFWQNFTRTVEIRFFKIKCFIVLHYSGLIMFQ